MDCRRRPCRSSRNFTAPPRSIDQWIPEHICSLCGKHRSSRYRKLHPITPGQAPEPGICSRPQCTKVVTDTLLRLWCRPLVEIHHHYHSSAGLEEPPPSYPGEGRRLTNPSHLTGSSRDLSPIQEEPSPFNTSSEPVGFPDCTAAELSGESSGRVELPDNIRSLRRNQFRRLTPIPEELPPPVNFLKKPRLQKMNKEAL
jgi:hypothetical protein